MCGGGVVVKGLLGVVEIDCCWLVVVVRLRLLGWLLLLLVLSSNGVL